MNVGTDGFRAKVGSDSFIALVQDAGKGLVLPMISEISGDVAVSCT
jgi:hypothetical protein